MADSAEGAGRGLRVLLWSARITGAIFVATLAFTIVVNFVTSTSEPLPQGSEWFGLAMFPFGVFVAYALAFRFRLIGGALAIVCLFGWWVFVGFEPKILPIAVLVAIPGVLYVTHALLLRRSERRRESI
ncbi:MAG: hypothetical protein U9Q95_05120 [Candidatus Eisenbacteria bacterium]|nr:hypothetical protein [Candidatus Eisenbacteria bacterium]